MTKGDPTFSITIDNNSSSKRETRYFEPWSQKENIIAATADNRFCQRKVKENSLVVTLGRKA